MQIHWVSKTDKRGVLTNYCLQLDAEHMYVLFHPMPVKCNEIAGWYAYHSKVESVKKGKRGGCSHHVHHDDGHIVMNDYKERKDVTIK